MNNSFSEVKLFQVKPDKLDEFESLVTSLANEQKKQPGAINIKYMKRFFTIDGLELGNPPRELTAPRSREFNFKQNIKGMWLL